MKCNHLDSVTNHSLIVFDSKWYGVFPKKMKGICKKCHQHFFFTTKQYSDFLESGVIPDEALE